jgi:hypothetical protein
LEPGRLGRVQQAALLVNLSVPQRRHDAAKLAWGKRLVIADNIGPNPDLPLQKLYQCFEFLRVLQVFLPFGWQRAKIGRRACDDRSCW